LKSLSGIWRSGKYQPARRRQPSAAAAGEALIRRRYPIFLEVRRQRFNLSEFDRVSLSRGFGAGYQVSLVGRDQELKVFLMANLGTVCHRAEEVAAECGTTVSDQL
jgi:hypothetical protein